MKVEQQGDILRCTPEVNLQASHAEIVRDDLLKVIKDNTDWQVFILDCSHIEQLDSIGLNLLVGLFKKLRALNKELQIIECGQSIVRMLKLFRLDEHISIEQTDAIG